MSYVPHMKQHAKPISLNWHNVHHLSSHTHVFVGELDFGNGLVRSFAFMHPISYPLMEEVSSISLEGTFVICKKIL